MMGTALLAIVSLSLACLIVLGAIVAILRSAHRERAAKVVRTGDTTISGLAQRIRAAQPVQLREGARRIPPSAQFGRMPELPQQSGQTAAGFGASGEWNTSQPAHPSAAAGPRLGSGPLVPIHPASPLFPLSSLPRHDSDPRGVSASFAVSGGLVPGWPSPPVSSASGGLAASNRRIPGFAIEDMLAAIVQQTQSPLTAAEEQRLREAAYVYDDGIRLAFDPQLGVVDLIFASCPLKTELEVILAFTMLNERFEALLRPVGRDRAALLVDVAGLEIRAEVTEAWVQALRQFLLARCAPAGAGRILLARYNSRIHSGQDRSLTLQRIQTATVTAALNSQTRIFGSREEAAALIQRLRELAMVAG